MKTKIKIIKSKKTSEPFGGFLTNKPILIDRNKIGLINFYEVWEGDLIEKEKVFIFYPQKRVESEIKIKFYTESIEIEIIDPFGRVDKKVSLYGADDLEKIKDFNLPAEEVDKLKSFFYSLAEKKAEEKNKKDAIKKMALNEYIHNEYTLDIQECNGRGFAFLKNNSTIEKLEFDCGDFWHEKPEVIKLAEYCYDKYSAVEDYFKFKGIALDWEAPEKPKDELILVFTVETTQVKPERVLFKYSHDGQVFYVPEPDWSNDNNFLEWENKFQELEIKTAFGSVIYEPKVDYNIDSYGLGSVIYQYVVSQLEEGWGTRDDQVHEYKYFVYERYKIYFKFFIKYEFKEKKLDNSLLEDGLSNEFIKKIKNYFKLKGDK